MLDAAKAIPDVGAIPLHDMNHQILPNADEDDSDSDSEVDDDEDDEDDTVGMDMINRPADNSRNVDYPAYMNPSYASLSHEDGIASSSTVRDHHNIHGHAYTGSSDII
jgi:hypothetical protein